jgi:hypothetical protein
VNLRRLGEKLGLLVLTPELDRELERDVVVGHVSDMLSDVLAHAPAGAVLVTIQVHLNVIAVGSHAGLAAVVFAAGRRPEEDVRRKALEERLGLFASPEPAFEVVGRLYALGVKGRHA